MEKCLLLFCFCESIQRKELKQLFDCIQFHKCEICGEIRLHCPLDTLIVSVLQVAQSIVLVSHRNVRSQFLTEEKRGTKDGDFFAVG